MMNFLMLALTAAENETSEEVIAPVDTRVINYASMDAGAIVLEAPASSKGFHNLLLDDKDKYGMTPCSEDKKMIVLGLSEEIQLKEVVLAQYEKYSSGVREFQVLGSRTFPTKEWVHLGEFEATYGEGEQAFPIEPKWVRYLKLSFTSHYGDEYMCTLSQIKVHGVTVMENFQDDLSRHHKELEVHMSQMEPIDPPVEDPPPELELPPPDEALRDAIGLPEVARLPEVDCRLDFKAFKDRMLSRVTAQTMDLTPETQYESIFKTLMDRIKAFEINQTIAELYLAQLHTCHAAKVDDLEKKVDKDREELLELVRSQRRDLDDPRDALAAATLAFVLLLLLLLGSTCLLCCRIELLRSSAAPSVHHHYSSSPPWSRRAPHHIDDDDDYAKKPPRDPPVDDTVPPDAVHPVNPHRRDRVVSPPRSSTTPTR